MLFADQRNSTSTRSRHAGRASYTATTHCPYKMATTSSAAKWRLFSLCVYSVNVQIFHANVTCVTCYLFKTGVLYYSLALQMTLYKLEYYCDYDCDYDDYYYYRTWRNKHWYCMVL